MTRLIGLFQSSEKRILERRVFFKKNHKKNSFLFGGILIVLLSVGFLAFYLWPKITAQSKKTDLVIPVAAAPTVEALKIALSDQGIEMEKLQYSTESAIISGTVKNGPQVLFSDEQDAASQASTLQLIITRLTIEKKDPRVVDLRFDKPIVKF